MPDSGGPSVRTQTGNLTDLRPKKRNRRAEADRHRMFGTETRRRCAAAMRAAGMNPEPWQVEALAAALVTNDETPSNEDLIRALMSAPWFPKPTRRQWQLGEGPWRTAT